MSSPAAGGLFTGNAGASATSARWSKDVCINAPTRELAHEILTRYCQNVIGQAYNNSYGKPSVEDAVARVRQAADKHRITGHAAALRWTKFHSILDGKHGDAVIFGARNVEQLRQSLDAFEAGPLPEELADAISAVYEVFEDGEEPLFHL